MEKKNLYTEKLDSEFEKYNENIDKLITRADNASDGVKTELTSQIEMLKRKRADIEGKIFELKHAGEEIWESIMQGTQDSLDDIKQGIRSAGDEF